MRRYAGAIAQYDGRVALVREQYEAWDAPYWNLPSGSVEVGETPTAGAIRELLEETGLRAEERSLELAWTTGVVVDGLDGLAVVELRGGDWAFALDGATWSWELPKVQG